MPASQVVIREPTPEELPRVAALGAKLIRQHHAYDPARFMCLEPVEEGYERYFASQLGRRETVILAALAEGEVAGYAYGRIEGRDWDMLRDRCGVWSDLYVDERFRGRGIARALSAAMLSELKARGGPRVVLYAASANLAARRLFESLGFRATMIEMTREVD